MIRRVPQGQTAATTDASLLDYSLARPASCEECSEQGLTDSYIDWTYAPADHGWLVTIWRWRRTATKRRPKTWDPDDDDKVRADAATFFDDARNLHDFEHKLYEPQDKHSSSSTSPTESASSSKEASTTNPAPELARQTSCSTMTTSTCRGSSPT